MTVSSMDAGTFIILNSKMNLTIPKSYLKLIPMY